MKTLKILTIIAILTLFFALLFGCKSSKDKFKSEVDRETTESSKTTITRIGDTVTYVVPNIILKDTVVTTTNRVTGTTQILRYNEEGKLTAAECVSGFINIVEESNKKVIEAIQESNKHKESEVSSIVILYFMIGLCLLFITIGGALFFMIKKQMSVLTNALSLIK